MIMVIQHLYLVPMFVSAMLSLKAFRLSWPLAYKIFSIFLFTALFTELLGNLWHYYLHNFNGLHYSENNAWIYSASFIPQYGLLMFVYHQILESRILKRLVVITVVVFSIFAIFNFCYWQKFLVINSYTHVFADGIMLLLVFAYFEQVRQEKSLVKLSTQPMVWISLGVLIFHLLSIPYLLSIEFLYLNYKSLATSFIYVYLLFIFASYVLYSKTFLCPTPRPKSSV
jgi:hypothetical protein